MSHELGVPFAEFCSYAWIKKCLQHFREDGREDHDLLFEKVCHDFGFEAEEFDSYICGQDDLACKVLGPEWGGEWNEISDLRQDAGDGMFGD